MNYQILNRMIDDLLTLMEQLEWLRKELMIATEHKENVIVIDM